MNESSHQLSLKLMHRCPSCHAGIPNSQIHVLSESEHAILAHTHCIECMTNFLTHIMNSPEGIIGNAISTDANAVEARRLLQRNPLTEDDFLTLYKATQSEHFIDNIKLAIKKR